MKGVEGPGGIREMVAEDYARLAQAPLGIACCPGSAPDHGTAVLAGYGSEDLGSLSNDVQIFSFGCGNPVASAGIAEGATVLDLGSGAGLDLLLAARRAGPSGTVVGVDMAGGMAARAKESAAAAGLENVNVLRGIMESLPVASATVDRALANCAVSLSPEKQKVFAETARVLKPGGGLFMADIVVGDLPAWVRENRSLYSGCVAGALGEGQYLDGLVEAGLKEVRVRERRLFGEAELKTFLQVGVTGSSRADPCSCSGFLAGRLLSRTAEKLAGKVGSVLIEARCR
jgi:ubiquinone/menaquinone biosynthesis C-methylase UbiE